MLKFNGMAEMRFLTRAEQIARYLQVEIAEGRWHGKMPGRMELAAELGLNARTVEDALRQLERDGVLIPQGAGRRRKIVQPDDEKPRELAIGFMMYEQTDQKLPHHIDLFHRLEDAGHRVMIAERTLTELGMNIERVEREVKSIDMVNAWIVVGASFEVLEWFARNDIPVISMFGRFDGLSVAAAGVRKIPALKKALKRLHELGHRRIVMLSREERRKPFPAKYERAFLDEMDLLGIQTGPYNLPDWDNNIQAFHQCLDSLFKHTPPTALLLNEAHLFVAAQQHLARMGLIAPRDVSMICDDPADAFSWCDPPISHIYWDSRPVVSRIIRWADRISRRIEDKRQRFTLAEFIEGGTIGPVSR